MSVKVRATVMETITVRKEVEIEIEEGTEVQEIEAKARKEAFKKLIIDNDHGWELVFSNGTDVEVDVRPCSKCGKMVCHEAKEEGMPPEAEYHEGEAFCPECWNFGKDLPEKD